MRVRLLLVSLVSSLAAVACEASRPELPPTPATAAGSASVVPPAPPDVSFSATISAASIGRDCPPAPAAGAASASMPAPAAGQVDRARLAQPGDVSDDLGDAAFDRAPRAPCSPSELQLFVQLAGAPRATIRIASVAVTDANGAPIGAATPSAPRRWDHATSTYAPWDGVLDVAAARVSYALAPVTPLGTGDHGVRVVVEAVLPSGAVLRSEPSYLGAIAPEPHVVT